MTRSVWVNLLEHEREEAKEGEAAEVHLGGLLSRCAASHSVGVLSQQVRAAGQPARFETDSIQDFTSMNTQNFETQGGAPDACLAHNQVVAGSIPAPATSLPQGEIGWAANLAGYNKADADRPKDRVGSPNKPLMRKVNGSCDSRPLQGIACQNFESLSPVALDRGSNTSAPCRLMTGAPEQEPLSPPISVESQIDGQRWPAAEQRDKANAMTLTHQNKRAETFGGELFSAGGGAFLQPASPSGTSLAPAPADSSLRMVCMDCGAELPGSNPQGARTSHGLCRVDFDRRMAELMAA